MSLHFRFVDIWNKTFAALVTLWSFERSIEICSLWFLQSNNLAGRVGYMNWGYCVILSLSCVHFPFHCIVVIELNQITTSNALEVKYELNVSPWPSNEEKFSTQKGETAQCSKLVISFFPLVWQRLNYCFGVIVARFKRKLEQTSPPSPKQCFTQSGIFFRFLSWRLQQFEGT